MSATDRKLHAKAHQALKTRRPAHGRPHNA